MSRWTTTIDPSPSPSASGSAVDSGTGKLNPSRERLDGGARDGCLEVLDGSFVVEAVGRLFESGTSLRHEGCELGGQRIGACLGQRGDSWFDGFIEAIGRIRQPPAEMPHRPASRRVAARLW